MRKLKHFCVIGIIAVFTMSCNKPYKVTPNDWPQFKNDNYRSGKSDIAIFDNSFGEKWVYKASQVPSPAWYGPAKEDAYAKRGPLPSMRDYDLAYTPIIVNGKMYYGSSSDDAIHCIDSKTGKEEWVFLTNGPIRIAPTYWEGNLYFGSDDGYVYCINAKTGEDKWKFTPSKSEDKLLNNGRLISFWPIRTGVLIEDGKAYFGASLLPWKKSYLCAVDAETGKVYGEDTYVKELDDVTFEGSMVSSGERIIQPQGRISPVFIDRKTGEIEGQLPGAGGCFVLVTPDNHVVNTQTSRHRGIWETIPGKEKPEYMAFNGGKEMIVSDNTSFVLSDNSITAYDRKSKEIIWSDETYYGHRIILADTVLFVGATDTIYAVSVSNGKPLWKGHVEGTVYAMAVADSSLFASTGEGKIYCFSKNGKQRMGKQSGSRVAFVMPDSIKIKRHPLKIISGPYAKALNRDNIALTFKTVKPEKCTLYWHSNGYIVKEVFNDASTTTEHNFILPVRKNFIYKYWIESKGKSTPEFEYDNFFNYTKLPVHVSDNWSKDKKTSNFVKNIIDRMSINKGVCLILGMSTQLPVELAQETDMDVIVLDESESKVNEFRDKLLKEGIYGRRISAYAINDLSKTLVQSNLADLVICLDDDIDIDEVIRITAPKGKAVYLTGDDKETLENEFYNKTEESNLDWDADKEYVKLGGKFAVVLTKKIPETNGVWTHEYANSSNSSFGGEDLWGNTSSEDFEVQWMGRPGPRFQTDRNGRKPSPLAINGKMFVQGNQRVVAINVYNGTILWSKDIIGMMRMNVLHDCSNWAADDKYIYIVVKDKLLELDQNTGEVVKQINVPAKDVKESDWGYIGIDNGLVFISESPKDSRYTDFYGSYGWYDARRGPAAYKRMSTKLLALKPLSENIVWQYSNGNSKIINPTIISYNNKIYFVESATAKLSKKKRGADNIFNKIYLVCLDAKDGSLNWRKKLNNKHGISAYYLSAGAGRIVIESSNDFFYYLYGYDSKTGELVWNVKQKWSLNNHGGHSQIPAIVGTKLIVKPVTFNVLTGEKLDYFMPRTGGGCGTCALSKNSVFYRDGSVTQYSFDVKNFTKWERLRPDCWISTIPALGMVLSPEAGGGCSCGNWLETSMVMSPKSRAPIMFKYDGSTEFIDTILVSIIIKEGIIGEVYYTTDGSKPDKKSNKYKYPINIDRNTNLRAVIYTDKENRERKFIRSKYFERLRPAPIIEPEKLIIKGKRNVVISKKGETGVILYTLDGSIPNENSPIYKDKISIDKKTTLKTITIWDEDYGTLKSKVTTLTVDVPKLNPALNKKVQPGLIMDSYKGVWHNLPDFSKLKVVKHRTVNEFSNALPVKKLNNYGMVFSGYIRVPEDGLYTLYINSSDGSILYIDNKKVVVNDGEHATVEKSGIIPLEKGLHEFKVDYFNSTHEQALNIEWETPTSNKEKIPASVLVH